MRTKHLINQIQNIHFEEGLLIKTLCYWGIFDAIVTFFLYPEIWGEGLRIVEYRSLSTWEDFFYLIDYFQSPTLWFCFIILRIIFLVFILKNIFPISSRIAHFYLLFSLNLTDLYITNGGNAFERTLWFYTIFITLKPQKESVAKLVSNLAMLSICIQQCIVYLESGLTKVQGPLWQTGTAIYYILNIPKYDTYGIGRYLTQFDLFVVIGSYFPIFFQLSFTPLILSRYRFIALFLGCIFHLSVAFLMGLWSFFPFIIGYIAFFREGDLEKTKLFLKQLTRSFVGVKNAP